MPQVPAQLTPAQQAMIAAQNNMNARGLVTSQGVRMRVQLPSLAVIPAAQNVVQFLPLNAGLLTGFLVKVQGTIHNGNAANPLALTPLGASQMLSNINFTDMWNNVRINTGGWHLHLVNSAKHPLVFGGAYAPNIPVGYGNNWTVMQAAAAPGFGTDAICQFYYYIPVAYSRDDLRGSILTQVLSSQQPLSLTINPTPVAVAGADATLTVYSNGDSLAVAGWKAATQVTITVWQDFIDNLPTDQNGKLILPLQDLQYVYELRTQALGGIVVGQDFAFNYPNWKQFMSTTVIIDNGGTLNAGSDVNYFNLQAANATKYWQIGPNEAALLARVVFQADPPKGVYHFESRDKPVNTVVFGNTGLYVNMSQVNAGLAMIVGTEDLAVISQLQYSANAPT
jgi:hypothetical protein